MIDKKSSITIVVPCDITEEEIKKIRQEFKCSELHNEYRLNIIISGCADPAFNLGAFLSSYVKK